MAFAIVIDQGPALIGDDGLLPAQVWLDRIVVYFGDVGAAQGVYPSLFLWTGMSDDLLLAVGWTGATLSAATLLGFTNGLTLLVLWALYLSITNIGQLFWGYGWENQLLETGLLAVFLCPFLRAGPLTPGAPPPPHNIGLFRWLIFRIMLGAGLIKLRGDPCWRDLTCLVYHYETQPIPHPLSWVLHQLPVAVHKGSVVFNHFVELVVPFAAFGPRRLRHVAGALLVLFQVTLIVSGNLSFLNWLTLIPCIACFDDSLLGRLVPGRAGRLVRHRISTLSTAVSPAARGAAIGFAALVVMLSWSPVANLLSDRQAMNTSFEPLNVVNTYGAFGSVGKTRNEIVIMGTLDEQPGPDSEWLEYEFRCKPGDPATRPCLTTPYHNRLDWQIWFAAMQRPSRNRWLAHFIYKLLIGDEQALALIASDPFRGVGPPRWIRADLYRYEFTDLGEPGWWRRRRVGRYFGPLSADHSGLISLVEELTTSP